VLTSSVIESTTIIADLGIPCTHSWCLVQRKAIVLRQHVRFEVLSSNRASP
jgi:hypothetical protein